MIQIPRSVARKFRAVFRKTVLPGEPTPRPPAVLFHASRDGLVMRSQSIHVAVEYDLPGKFAPEQLAIPLDALERFEGRDDSPVSLESASGKIIARWTDSGVPQVVEFEAVDPKTLLGFPGRPETWASNTPDLLRAICDASETADESGVRHAVHLIQLRGKTGSVVGTDGRQLLIQSGFSFPFSEDVLVPRVPFFGCREFAGDAPIEVGKTENYIAVRVSPWTFHLRLDKEGRFPRINSIVPDANAALATIRVSPEDAEFLAQTLPQLPGGDEPDSPVTIDCNGFLAVRAIANGQKTPTELVLAHSEVSGQAIRYASNRTYLARALNLGFREFRLYGPGSLALCQEDHRQYMWMGLGKDAILAPADDAIRITSVDAARTTSPKNGEAKKPVSNSPASNGKANGKSTSKAAAKGHGIGAAIDEAQALKTVLRDAYHRSSQLVVSLKRHRKQAKLMRSTIAALRQLAPIEH